MNKFKVETVLWFGGKLKQMYRLGTKVSINYTMDSGLTDTFEGVIDYIDTYQIRLKISEGRYCYYLKNINSMKEIYV